jgi:hypothetical protein
MAYWRMRLRDGFGSRGGEDLWPACKKHLVAAITYNGVHETDLSVFSRGDHPPNWDEVRGGKGSLSHFVWDIRGGDTIYVADSMSHQIVGMGYARAKLGEVAYRFDRRSPIEPSGGPKWCHLIDVDWDEAFVPFAYEHPRSGITTVLELNETEVHLFGEATQKREHRDRGLSEEDAQDTVLLGEAYPRYTSAAMRLIQREHVHLSNTFKAWLRNGYNIRLIQERQRIDALFKNGRNSFLVEFKIAYQGNTTRAIREALGQILEYNHYPKRSCCDRWLLVLNVPPSAEDVIFVSSLREKYSLPITLGWRTDVGFEFEPHLDLR